MGASGRFESYMEHVAAGLGHAVRNAGLKSYCTGRMLPGVRKSFEPMAARIDPLHASARNQSLRYFVAKADWSDVEILKRVRRYVAPKMDCSAGGYWFIDDSGFPTKGTHSVGVAGQYCGVLGKQHNFQVTVGFSLDNEEGNLLVAYQVYLPKDWTQDRERRTTAGVLADINFATKAEIALEFFEHFLFGRTLKHLVMADAAYGADTGFRRRLEELGPPYLVDITSALVVWPPGVAPLSPKRYRGQGRAPVMSRGTNARPPQSVKALAEGLPASAFRTIRGREGPDATLSGHLAAGEHVMRAATPAEHVCNRNNGC